MDKQSNNTAFKKAKPKRTNDFRGNKPSENRFNHTSKDGRRSNRVETTFKKGPKHKRPQRTSSIKDPSILIKKSVQQEEIEYISKRLISELPISDKLKESLSKKGYTKPTEIQDRTIEDLLQGSDLLGIAQTGTGKTGAFLIPIIEQLIHNKQKPYALIVVPTRELATQVEEEFKSMTKGLNLFSSCFIGGTNINKDIQACRRPSHIIIATPGRLLDLVTRKLIDLREFNTLVLDEFDRMLDMGFVHDVNRIIRGMHRRQQTMLFSATLDATQESMINDILKDPIRVQVSNGDSSSDFIEQDIVRLKEGQDKFMVLKDMISQEDFKKVLIFEETKHKVKKLCAMLNKTGFTADEIHGNKSQNARQKALNTFKQGNVQILVATDVAARGIDVSNVTHVINYQLPLSYDSYIHRIGRTGRAGQRGKAYTFVD